MLYMTIFTWEPDKRNEIIKGSSPNRVGRSESKIIKKAYVLRVLDIVDRLKKVL